jgi:hypothetical protein
MDLIILRVNLAKAEVEAVINQAPVSCLSVHSRQERPRPSVHLHSSIKGSSRQGQPVSHLNRHLRINRRKRAQGKMLCMTLCSLESGGCPFLSNQAKGSEVVYSFSGSSLQGFRATC